MSKHWKEILVYFAGIIALTLLFPEGVYFILAVNILLILITFLMQITATLYPIKLVEKKEIEDEPFVSIHLPIYNEPADLVKKTIDSIHELNYSNYEVIVIDNNTKDKNVWLPVEDYCKKLGEKFRFYHYDNVKGYKAGALNIAYEKTDPRAEYISVIDADYILQRDFLKEAVTYFVADDIGLVQFPQAYRHYNDQNEGMVREYQHFFLFYMNFANYGNCVTSTGTVSVYNRKALNSLKGWNGECITEDSDLGTQLILNGYKTKYINKVMGRGILPLKLESIKKQRVRWVFGNMQILRGNFLNILKSKFLGIKEKYLIFLQLTAWFNFLFFPSITLLVSAGLTLVPEQNYTGIALFSGINIASFLLLKGMVFITGFLKKGYKLTDGLSAYATHLAMMFEGGASWAVCILNKKFTFERTSKFLPGNLPASEYLPDLLIASLFAIAGVLFIIKDIPSAGSISFIMSAISLFILYLNRQIDFTRNIMSKIKVKHESKHNDPNI